MCWTDHVRRYHSAIKLYGNLELSISNADDYELANQLIRMAYEVEVNLRLNMPNGGPNVWMLRRDVVKALIQNHEFDLFGT